MTVFIPLDPLASQPSTPSYLVAASDHDSQLAKVVKAIVKARKIVVVCGAGISVQAGIPDFRSPEGLFQSLKKDNPRELLSSGKDLFDSSVFKSEQTLSMFCQMIAKLSELSVAASPTPFHQILRSLDDRGKLLRVYTQNIDAIEAKTGLSFGVPEFEDKRYKPKTKSKITPLATPPSTPIRLPTPPVEVPRCIPLHGTIETLHCQSCTHTFPLLPQLPVLAAGTAPDCPECTSLERTRQLIGKRSRGVGRLRPSVVLYNEAHREGEGVGEAVRRDLVGKRGRGASADLLLVVGTSLRVPGTKRIVREFSKAVKSKAGGESERSTVSGLHTPSSSPAPRRSADEEFTPRAVYLNLDFPVPAREWEGVFDVWLQGDAQAFANMLNEELEKETQMKLAAEVRKRKREEEAAEVIKEQEQELAEARARKKAKTEKKRKAQSTTPNSSAKRQKINKAKTVVAPTGSCARTRKLPTPTSTSKSRSMLIRVPPLSARPRRLIPEVVIPVKPKRISALRTPRTSRISQSFTTRTPVPFDDGSESELTDVDSDSDQHALPRFDSLHVGVEGEDDPGGHR